ncbi:type II secretion system protein [Cerasicoccus fimbriatus]|uniref:type II secretion system protein n=1 Tax=Cerasicoccus fimbriatus TaxID=3014554 RepID=UPI0022B3212D|nr:prepilin-type N-terminal cleavage/methylation domain-containing protein [Cerasicoccus sp. TK19100]
MNTSLKQPHRGFTILEIMVVVLIIGVLLAMAIPGFQAVRERTRVAAFLNDFRAVTEAVNRYNLTEGVYPVGTGNGPPADFYDYIRADVITNTTVIGGNWTVDASNYQFAIGISGYEASENVIVQIDQAVDDGNLATGQMIESGANTFLFIIEE